MINEAVHRHSFPVAIGGGAVLDMAGFALQGTAVSGISECQPQSYLKMTLV
jgi:3-dehydroquinate synthetase